jgi:hypothetical protein
MCRGNRSKLVPNRLSAASFFPLAPKRSFIADDPTQEAPAFADGIRRNIALFRYGEKVAKPQRSA